jgi:hypothetical protein
MFNKFYNENVTVPSFFSFLESLTFETIYYLKYLFTFLFFIIFYGISILCIKFISKEKVLVKWLHISYLTLFVLSGFAMLWAYFIKLDLGDEEYTFSRWLMGIAQSPLPVLFILATSKLSRDLNKHEKL